MVRLTIVNLSVAAVAAAAVMIHLLIWSILGELRICLSVIFDSIYCKFLRKLNLSEEKRNLFSITKNVFQMKISNNTRFEKPLFQPLDSQRNNMHQHRHHLELLICV